jgi:transposase
MTETQENIKILKEIERATKDKQLALKILSIRLVFEGYSVQEAAFITNCCEKTVYNNLKKYEKGGIPLLHPNYGTGRPRKMTTAQEEELYDTIKNKLPNEVGFAPFANWTSSFAAKWIEQKFNIQFSDRGVRKIFERLNLSYTRPTYTLKKADPEKQEAFINEFEQVKMDLIFDEIQHILFEDESMIRDYQAIMKTWFPKGEQRIIPTYGKHCGAKLVGILDYETGSIYVEEHEKYDAQVFLSFLENVLSMYPTGKIVIVLDNAKIHHAKLLEEFLSKNLRLTLMFLPPYSPKLNIIEGLWGWLKNSVINNVFFKNREEICSAVSEFISWVNTVPLQVIDRLCVQL